MIRHVALFSILAVPMAIPATAQTALSERPGLWISVPRTAAPVAEAPVAGAVVLEAPEAGPLITAEPSANVILTAPETAVLIAPPVAPETRPVPRPRDLVIEDEVAAPPAVVAVPDIAIAAVTPAPRSVPEIVGAAVPAAPIEAPAVPEVTVDIVPADDARPAPIQIQTPTPRPDAAATVARAEALAAQIAAEAHAITVAAPRAVPRVEENAPPEVLPPLLPSMVPAVEPVPSPQAAARTNVPRRVLTPPSVVPILTVAFTLDAASETAIPMSAVLLPGAAVAARSVPQPLAVVMPPLEAAPILPRLHPSGPLVLDAILVLGAMRPALVSAVLLPSRASPAAPAPQLARARLPERDRFPMSALPPSALPRGPESLARAIQPPPPFAEVNAAVLTGVPSVIPVRLPALAPSATPAFETPFTDPEAPVVLPAPDAGAVARMMDDAMICWRLADLGVEAQWARLSVDVALDETNRPSAESIRLTGFAHVISGAAEEAYRSAHAALMGCAEATAGAPATTSSTLVFDRSGVRLQ